MILTDPVRYLNILSEDPLSDNIEQKMRVLMKAQKKNLLQ